MKAVNYTSYGPASVMKLADVPKPAVSPGHVLVRVRAASINPIDWKLRNGLMKLVTGKTFPRGMGCDLAGVVEQLGPGVSSFSPGDEVFGWLPYKSPGSFAQYALVPTESLVHKPENLSMEQAACLPMAASTAYQSLVHTAKLSQGERVLVNGCSGGVGLFALQIAHSVGATVVGTCSKTNADLALAFGADSVVDYHETDVFSEDERFDVILDASGHGAPNRAKRILAPGGRLLDLSPTPIRMLKSALSRWYNAVTTTVTAQDLSVLSELIQNEELRVHVGAQFPLNQALDALTAAESGQAAAGKTVITIA